MFKNRKILMSSLLTLGIIFPLIISNMAFANTGGGIGGGPGGGTITGAQWISVTGARGDTYDKFINLNSGHNSGYVDQQLNQRINSSNGKNGVDLCKSSTAIWYVADNEGDWVANWSGSTMGSSSIIKGSINNPNKTIGNAPTQSETQSFLEWDSSRPGGPKLNSAPGYVIICNGAYIPEDEFRDRSSSSLASSEKENFYNQTLPYAWTTEVKPQIISGGKDIIGKDNLHGQVSEIVYTNFSKIWNEIKNSPDLPLDDVKNKVSKAIEEDKKLSRAKIDLDEKNIEGIGEGGVLNFLERTQYGTLSSTEVVTTDVTTSCKWQEKRTWVNGTWTDWTTVSGTKKCDDSSKITKKNNTLTNLGTLNTTGFWQMLVVQCNKIAFDKIVSSDSTIKEIKTDNGEYTSVAYSKKYDSQPQYLDFGDSRNSDPNKAETANLGFYDKECGYTCIADSDPNKGATKDNGALTNIGDKNAISGETIGRVFQFYRDNIPKEISIDVWYPENNSNLKYDGSSPKTTTINRWDKGTPGVKISKDDAGVFTMKSKNDTKLFENGNSSKIQGLNRDFTVQSTWVSEKDLPQALNFKWEYEPSIISNIPTKNIGFGADGTLEIGKTNKIETPVKGQCYAQFGGNSKVNWSKLFQENTGTGNNKLDKSIINSENIINEPTSLIVNFIRSVAE